MNMSISNQQKMHSNICKQRKENMKDKTVTTCTYYLRKPKQKTWYAGVLTLLILWLLLYCFIKIIF